MARFIMLAPALVAVAAPLPAAAGVGVSGTVELNYITQKGAAEFGDHDWHSGFDVAVVINLDGETPQLGAIGKLNFRVAQKGTQYDRTPAVGSRETWVGAVGTWGALRVGRQFFNSYLVLDWPYGQGGFWELAERDLGNWQGGGKVTASIRMPRALNYLSPKLGRWSFGLQHGWMEKANHLRDGQASDVSVSYTTDDLRVNAGWLTAQGIDNFDSNTDGGDRDRQHYLGAVYQLAPGWSLRGLPDNLIYVQQHYLN